MGVMTRERARAGATAAVVVAIVVGLLWWLGDRPGAPSLVAPSPALTLPADTLAARCAPAKPFRPVAAVITGLRAPVVALPRDANDVPRTPQLTPAGKGQVAWDQPPGPMPGSRHGNVLLNTHTWPDGSALGNRLLDRLHEGDRFELRGAAGQRLCYRVTERVEVRAADGFPRYYEDIGRPQAAIIVCSGRRLGPENWTHRTIWFARPVTS